MKFFESADFLFVIVAIIIAVFAFFVIRSYSKKLSQGCCGAAGDTAKEEKIKVADKNKKHYPFCTVLTVDGMVCGACAQRVENALNSIGGVWASADVLNGKVTVRSKAKLSEQTLRNAVNNIGAYTVMKIEE